MKYRHAILLYLKYTELNVIYKIVIEYGSKILLIYVQSLSFTESERNRENSDLTRGEGILTRMYIITYLETNCYILLLIAN